MITTFTEPLLRFPEFIGKYKEYKLSELLSRSSEINKDEEFSIDEILSLSAQYGIVNRKGLLEEVYSKVNHKTYIKTRLNDFVYGKSISSNYPYGLFKVNNYKDGLLSTLYYTFKVTGNIIPIYLDYYFSLHTRANNYLRKYVLVGDRYINADSNYILSGKIYLPTINDEQKKITSFLAEIDKRLRLLKEKKKNLDQYKKGISQKIFSQKLRFKDENGQAFPKWRQYILGELFFENLRPLEKPQGEYKAIGVRSHFKGTFLKYENAEKNQMETLYQVCENDLIVNITFAWEGAVAIAKKCDNDGLVSHRFPTYKANTDLINIKFFEFLFPNNKFKKELSVISPGGAGRNRVLKRSDFLKLKFNVPSINEQLKITNFLSSIEDKVNFTQSQIEKTELYKKGLLQKMFC